MTRVRHTFPFDAYPDLTFRQAMFGPLPRLTLTRWQRARWAVDQAVSYAILLWLLR